MVSLAAITTIAVWNVPYGRTILWPFTLLATWVHEMGHGMAAQLLTRFSHLEIYRDGGGVAYTGHVQGHSLKNAIIAAAGLLGPAIAGSAIIVFGRKEKDARYLLGFLATAMALSLAIYVRNMFGLFAVGGWVLALGIVAYAATDKICYFLLQFIGIQFCINNFKDFRYMFTQGFRRADGVQMVSDSENIARNLFLPYWFWGGLIAATSIALLLSSLYIANRSGSGAPSAPISDDIGGLD